MKVNSPTPIANVDFKAMCVELNHSPNQVVPMNLRLFTNLDLLFSG